MKRVEFNLINLVWYFEISEIFYMIIFHKPLLSGKNCQTPKKEKYILKKNDNDDISTVLSYLK